MIGNYEVTVCSDSCLLKPDLQAVALPSAGPAAAASVLPAPATVAPSYRFIDDGSHIQTYYTSKALLWATVVLCFVHNGYCLCDHVIVVHLDPTGGPFDSTRELASFDHSRSLKVLLHLQ